MIMTLPADHYCARGKIPTLKTDDLRTIFVRGRVPCFGRTTHPIA